MTNSSPLLWLYVFLHGSRGSCLCFCFSCRRKTNTTEVIHHQYRSCYLHVNFRLGTHASYTIRTNYRAGGLFSWIYFHMRTLHWRMNSCPCVVLSYNPPLLVIALSQIWFGIINRKMILSLHVSTAFCWCPCTAFLQGYTQCFSPLTCTRNPDLCFILKPVFILNPLLTLVFVIEQTTQRRPVSAKMS